MTNIILYTLMVIGCSIVAVNEESTLAGTVGFCFLWAILVSIGKKISERFDKVDFF